MNRKSCTVSDDVTLKIFELTLSFLFGILKETSIVIVRVLSCSLAFCHWNPDVLSWSEIIKRAHFFAFESAAVQPYTVGESVALNGQFENTVSLVMLPFRLLLVTVNFYQVWSFVTRGSWWSFLRKVLALFAPSSKTLVQTKANEVTGFLIYKKTISETSVKNLLLATAVFLWIHELVWSGFRPNLSDRCKQPPPHLTPCSIMLNFC